MHLLLNRWTKQLQTLQVYRSHDVEGTGQFSRDLDTKGQGQIMFFLVNASPEPLDIATQIAGA